MREAIEKAGVLIEALPYIRSFRRKFVVIKLGGSAMGDVTIGGANSRRVLSPLSAPVLGRAGDGRQHRRAVEARRCNVMRSVIEDMVFMEHAALWPVLVHGGGKAISEEMKRAGVEPEFVRGHRVTTPEVMEIVARVLIEQVSARICALVEDVGGKAMPLNGRGSSFLLGKKRTLPDAPDADLGLVGEITRVDREACYRLCDGGLIPVVAPVARLDPEDEGAMEHPAGAQLLNVNADSAASAIAAGLGAEKVVFMSNVPGVLADPDDESSLISSIHRDDVDDLVKSGVIAGGMLPKVRACIEAIERGVGKAHIVSALLPHALLLEMFTDKGIGTEIVRQG